MKFSIFPKSAKAKTVDNKLDFEELGFDPVYYRESSPDLHHFSTPRDLYQHYITYGRAEGRSPSRNAMIADLESHYGKLPDDFDPRHYVSLYPDLTRLRLTDRQAVEHYLRHGREEGRAYLTANCDIFRELYLHGQIISDRDLSQMLREEEFVRGKLITGADIMRSKGLDGGGRWIEEINVDEFAYLNFSWAGPIHTRMEAVDAMLVKGIELLSPLSLRLDFDASFYREFEPSIAAQGDADAYRHWLFRGFETRQPGSPRQFFEQLGIELETFPASFPWRRYVSATRDLPRDSTRWTALRHFVFTGFAKDPRFVEGEDASIFLKALGTRFRGYHPGLSVKAFEMAQRFEALDDTATLLLADGYFSLGRHDPALAAYEAALYRGSPSPSSFCNAARAAVALGKYDSAFKILNEGKRACAGIPEYRKTAWEAIEAEFEEVKTKGKDLLKTRDRQMADRILTEGIARVSQRFAELDPLGVPLPVAPKAKVVIFANVDSPQCTHYRVDQKLQLFKALGRDCQIFALAEGDDFISALPGASAAIFFRLAALPIVVRAIDVARSLAIPTYYEIDDLLFDSSEYPEPFETYGAVTRRFYESLQFGVPFFRAALSLCDYGIASTTALAAHMRPLVRKGEVFVLPNGLDDLNLPFLAAPPRRTRRDDSIVIFYGSGTQAHNKDFMTLVAPGLLKLMTEDRRVKLMILGYLTLDASFDSVRDRIITMGWADLNSYWSLLAEADIAIAPLAPYATTDAKSEIKWIEASALCVPCVVSGTARYKEVLENNFDALIADDSEQWESALRRLIADPDLRKNLVANARKKLTNNYSIEANAKILSAILPTPQTKLPASRKRRVLLVNVFFHPQSLGGSPRVVRDNLDSFLDGPAREAFDFAVATTDFSGDGLHQLRVENYRDCPVFRVSPVKTVNLEWQPDIKETGEFFSEILNVWRPDLVHFHCVQKFSGSAVESCLKANIPYVVTVHDAWWISDWYFLTDSKDRLRDPGEWIPFDPPEPVSVGAAIERRRFLAPLLSNAQAILGVSKSFTNIYRSCGFADAIAVPNGVPRMKKAARRESKSGRVRLTHIGGQSKFKGYVLVEAAFKQRRFKNLELTVVDVTRFGGAEDHRTWGTTPVRIVGKTVSEDMHEYYAEQDVLLAPSLWPEAFGLVTREALAAGLWVVASDRGGIGEDVAPGANGWIIDVSTPQGLLDVLSQIDAEPAKYLASPPLAHPRTSEEQADEILGIYRRVLADPRPPEQPYARGTIQAAVEPGEALESNPSRFGSKA